MGAETIDYSALISDLEAKRSAIDNALAAIRLAQSIGALGQAGEGGVVPSLTVPSITGGEVPAGAFLGKSIPEAAKLYLAIVKRKQTSKDIAEALMKGGIESRSKSFNTQVHSILDRASKAGSGIVKLDRSFWGLVEWYPAGVRAGLSQEKRGGRSNGKRRKPKTPAPTGALGAQERITSFLGGKGYMTPKDIAERTGLKIQTTHLLLGKLVNSNQVDKSPDRHYKLASTG